MKNQINLLNQLQELILTRDEHHQTGSGEHMDMLNASIDKLAAKLEPLPKMLYQRLYKKYHIIMSPVVNDCCALCGIKVPISQVQQVKLARSIQTCTSCGRILYNEESDAPRAAPMDRNASSAKVRKTGISRFSAEELMICDLKGTTPADAIAELAEAMGSAGFVSNPSGLVAAAMDRESVLSTAMEDGVAFPHVRGVEGGGLTLALGVSKEGIQWDSEQKVHLVFFSVIPVAVSAFYLKLMAGLMETCQKADNRKSLTTAETAGDLWKMLIKTTRNTVK